MKPVLLMLFLYEKHIKLHLACDNVFDKTLSSVGSINQLSFSFDDKSCWCFSILLLRANLFHVTFSFQLR